MENFEQKIMADIESGRVKLRSKYIFLAEKLGLSSALALTVLLAILLCNLVLFSLQTTDTLGYLRFGRGGLYAFLDSFPYLLVVGLIVAIFIVGLIVKKSGVLYKQPFTYMAIVVVGGVMAGGAAMSFTRAAEFIESQYYLNARARPVVAVFMRHLGERGGGIAGRVVTISTSSLQVQTPREVRLVLFVDRPQGLAPGVFIMAVGTWQNSIFKADRMRIVNPDELPAVRRGIRYRFDEQRVLLQSTP